MGILVLMATALCSAASLIASPAGAASIAIDDSQKYLDIDLSSYLGEEIKVDRICKVTGDKESCYLFDSDKDINTYSFYEPFTFYRVYLRVHNNRDFYNLLFPDFSVSGKLVINGKEYDARERGFKLDPQESLLSISVKTYDTSFVIKKMKFIKEQEREKLKATQDIITFFISGMLISLFIYLLSITQQRSYDQIYLALTVLIFMSIFKYAATESLLTPYLGNAGAIVAVYLSGTLFSFISFVFIKQKYGIISDRYLNFIKALSVTTFASGCLGAFAYSKVPGISPSQMLLLALTFGFEINVAIRIFRSRKKNYLQMVSAIFILKITFLWDSFNFIVLNSQMPWLSHWGMVAFLMISAVIVSKDFSDDFKANLILKDEVEKQNREIREFNNVLENKVIEKTREIRTLSDNIPQAVFMLNSEAKVEAGYFKHTEETLRTTDLAGKTFKEVILDHSPLSDDLKDQFWQTILSILGEPSLNYEMNSDKILREIPYKNGYLKLTLTPDFGEEDVCSKILVTALDITDEKLNEIEARKGVEQMMLVEELLAADEKRTAEFFVTAETLIKDVATFIEHEIDADIVKTIFVNLHTVKGGARTLGLKKLANVSHIAESEYSRLRDQRQDLKPDYGLLKANQARIEQVYGEYLGCFTEKLKRKVDFTGVFIEKDFLESTYKELGIIEHELANRHVSEVSRLIREHIERYKDKIIGKIYDKLIDVCENYKVQGDKIAKDIGKEPPNYLFNVVECNIPEKVKLALDKSMIHIMRNHLDHGIENREERLAKNKPARGTIRLEAALQNDRLLLMLSDDGRGINIKKLREMGLQQGLLKDSNDIHEVAGLIFRSGISTATRLSEISGRGVGMGAVKKFIVESGGVIDLKVGAEIGDGFHQVAFVLSFPIAA
jgi:HPt (histidine-containing phosphotransfer) domain-containing protein